MLCMQLTIRDIFLSDTPPKTFGYTYAGTVSGTVWMMTLGVILTAAIQKFLDNICVFNFLSKKGFIIWIHLL